MIFVTVGTQLPFDRLIDAMEAYAAAHPDETVVAQTGSASDAGRWPHLTLVQQLSPAAFAEKMQAARVVVAHAGIGTILSAMECQAPLILVPRQHALGEHRNDHQMATARQMEGRSGLQVCWEISDLDRFVAEIGSQGLSEAPAPAYASLISYLQNVLQR